MPTCAKCRKRSAKRTCPALGIELCQLCCGTLREKEIHCTFNCPHLAAHRPYQEKRIIDRNPGPGSGRPHGEDILNDERMAWLAFHIEAALRGFASAHPRFSDKDAILALEYAREKTKKGGGRIFIPGAPLKPKNEAGEILLQVAEETRYEPSTLLTPVNDAYLKDEKIACLERLAQGIKHAVGGRLEGRTFLDGLEARFAQTANEQQAKKLVTLR